MHVLARILTGAHREGFRRILRSMIAPGKLDVTGWSPVALRVLKAVCIEQGIQVETSIHSLARSFINPKFEFIEDSSVHIRPKGKSK
jgi:hypothetical protein